MEKWVLMFISFIFFNEFFRVSSTTYAQNHNVKSIFVFGDSTFDAGNNHYNKNCSAQADFPPYGLSFFHRPSGRFTNGRTVADFISQFMGIGLQQPFQKVQQEIANRSRKDIPANGINFASAGSGVLPKTNEYFDITTIRVQIHQFQSLINQGHINKKLLQSSFFFFESGSNDIFNYFMPFDTPTLAPDAFVKAMLIEVAHFVDQIYKLGARKIALFSLGPVGCVPARALMPGAPINRCFGKLNKMVKSYNAGLENLVKGIPIKYRGAVGVYGLVYNIAQRIRANPKHYGFANISDACCGDGTLNGMLQCGKEGYKMCSNPDEFFFWDFFHPSERTYKLVSDALWAGGRHSIRPMNLKSLAYKHALSHSL